MSTHDLRTILEALNQNMCGEKQSLRDRIVSQLVDHDLNTRDLKQTIKDVYKVRSHTIRQNTDHTQQLQLQQLNSQYEHQNPVQNGIEQLPVPQMVVSQVSTFENVPFLKTLHTVLCPVTFQKNNLGSVSSLAFYCLSSHQLQDINEHYRNRILLQFVQISPETNVTKRLPYNISVFLNGRQCTLPTLNYSRDNDLIIPWYCNLPIDITPLTYVNPLKPNTLKIHWAGEPHKFMAGVFISKILTLDEVLEDLKKKPLHGSNETKNRIKKIMESDTFDDLVVDSLVFSFKDPISSTKIKIPVRDKGCTHLKCFDAKTFLQINQQKVVWLCPVCNQNITFQNLEIDEFFLNILQSTTLSEDCVEIILYKDGSYAEKKPSVDDDKTNKHYEMTVLNSDDDDAPLSYEPNNITNRNESSVFEKNKKQGPPNVICTITLD